MDARIILQCHVELFTRESAGYVCKWKGILMKSKPQTVLNDDQDASM